MKKKIEICFFILSIILFILSSFCFYQTSKNVQFLNEQNSSFYHMNGSNVCINLSSGKRVSFALRDNVAIVYDSFQCDTKEDCIKVVLAIKEVAKKKELLISRANSDLIGELRLHNFLYKLGYRTNHTKNADLEYIKDHRWYVNAASRLIGWMGI